MIKDFRKTNKFKKIKTCNFFVVGILQLPHTWISNSEKLTHPSVQYSSHLGLEGIGGFVRGPKIYGSQGGKMIRVMHH